MQELSNYRAENENSIEQEGFDKKYLREMFKEFRDGEATSLGGRVFQQEGIRPKKE